MALDKRFVGAWTMTHFDLATPNGVRGPWAEGAHGLLIYTAQGYMSVTLNWTQGPDPASHDAYAGTYHVEGDHIIHQVTQTSRPWRLGRALRRTFRFEGPDTLHLTAEVAEGQFLLRWVRLM